MKIRANHIIIPLITVVVAITGTIFVQTSMEWYNTVLIKPELIPPRWAFPIAWNIIFILATISALWIWSVSKHNKRFYWIMGIFLFNAVLNAVWSLLFFKYQLILASFIEMLVLEMTTILLMILMWKPSKLSSYLLLPYVIWVGFATYITYMIMILN